MKNMRIKSLPVSIALFALLVCVSCSPERVRESMTADANADVPENVDWDQFHALVAEARECDLAAGRDLLARAAVDAPKSAEYVQALSMALEFFVTERPVCFADAFTKGSVSTQDAVRNRLGNPLYVDPLTVDEHGIAPRVRIVVAPIDFIPGGERTQRRGSIRTRFQEQSGGAVAAARERIAGCGGKGCRGLGGNAGSLAEGRAIEAGTQSDLDGGFAEVNGNVGPMQATLGLQAGVSSDGGYVSGGPSAAIGNSWAIKAGGAAGVEVAVYGGNSHQSVQENCKCSGK